MYAWPRYQRWLIIVVVTLSGLLSACGQKGPLYLPEPAQDEQVDKT
jgi:predicted small lipoprotein YifL